MVDTHFCTCEGVCSCGRPRARQDNAQVASEGVRLGQLEALYRRGERPTEDDIQFLQTGIRRTQNTGTAGRLLVAFGELGHVDGYVPRRDRRGAA
jgi:hypothetical protein